jgi:hypothetical protein
MDELDSGFLSRSDYEKPYWLFQLIPFLKVSYSFLGSVLASHRIYSSSLK